MLSETPTCSVCGRHYPFVFVPPEDLCPCCHDKRGRAEHEAWLNSPEEINKRAEYLIAKFEADRLADAAAERRRKPPPNVPELASATAVGERATTTVAEDIAPEITSKKPGNPGLSPDQLRAIAQEAKPLRDRDMGWEAIAKLTHRSKKTLKRALGGGPQRDFK
jgi:hypothetical protein